MFGNLPDGMEDFNENDLLVDPDEPRYLNRDPRLGDSVEFTMSEMIDLYRRNGWDVESGLKTDQQIIDDVLQHDVELVD